MSEMPPIQSTFDLFAEPEPKPAPEPEPTFALEPKPAPEPKPEPKPEALPDSPYRRELYLTRIYMESYGKYSQRTVETFKPGLNVIYGPNEAGKSTSAQLIRDVLYGWTRKAGGVNDYMPFAGDRCGSLYFASSEGEWELWRGKRNETKVIAHAGTSRPEAFEDVCREVTAKTFEDIFAFDSDRLRAIGHDDPEGITAKLLTAGSGTSMAPTQALEHVEERIRLLASHRSGLPEALGTIQSAIDGLEQQCAAKAEEARMLQQERLELEQASRQREQLERDLTRLKERARTLAVDCQSALSARDQTDELADKWRDAQSAFEDACDKASHVALTDKEALLLAHAEAIETANGEVAKLALCADRVDERKRAFEVAQTELDGMQSCGCLTDATVKQELMQRQKTRVELETSMRYAREALREAQAKNTGLIARDSMLADTQVVHASSRLLVILGIVALLGGCALAILSFLSASWLGVGGGAALVILGIVLVVLGAPRTQRLERETAFAEQMRRHEELAEEIGHLQGMFDHASEELAQFDIETEEFLRDSRLTGAKSNLDLALAMLEAEENVEYKRKERNAKKDYYALSYREMTDIAQSIRTQLESFDDEAFAMADRDYLTYVPTLYRRLLAAKEKGASAHHLDDKVSATRERHEVFARDFNAAQAQIEKLAAKYHVDEKSQIVEELERELASVDEAILKKQSAFDDLNTRVGELQSILEIGSHSTDLQKLREELEGQYALRKRSVRTYAELVLAREYLVSAIAEWERERQPRVFKLASELFSDMTNGRWIKASVEDSGVYATDGNYRKLLSYKLSTGTCQQLYLALRIALLIEGSDVGRSLPVIADDILVNFDATRREGAARALARLAKTRQVIVFTCHRQTQELLRLADKEANFFDLGV